MYTTEDLNRYEYFQEILKHNDINYLLDPLTGLLSRSTIISFTKSLIDHKTPFSFAMIDLDNFKEINDSYGHTAGDKALAGVAESLINYLGKDGVAGRFGGDEFLFISFTALSYQDKKQLCYGIYDEHLVLKREYDVGERNVRVTGTIGMASFPEDASSYDEIFSLIDKTLYRGKNKGRNCYIIYVEAKHKDIKIGQIRHINHYQTIKKLTDISENAKSLSELMLYGFEVLRDDMYLSDMFYLTNSKDLYCISSKEPYGTVPDIEKIITDEVTAFVDLTDVRDTCKDLVRILWEENSYGTAIIAKVNYADIMYGYIICTISGIHRLWQESDYSNMLVFAKLISNFLHIHNYDPNTNKPIQ